MQTALQCETFVSEFLLAGHHLPPVNLPLRIAYSSSRESAEEKNGREEAGEKFKQARRGPIKERAIGKKWNGESEPFSRSSRRTPLPYDWEDPPSLSVFYIIT